MRKFLIAAAAIAFALLPVLADARVGQGGSMGSRGSQTYSAPPTTNTAPYSASPMQRSMTPNTPAAPGYGQPGLAPQRPGLFGGGFASGLMGGLIGAGIGGLLFGHGFFGGMGSMGGFLGFLIQIFLIVMIGRWLLRMFLNRQPAMAGGPGLFARNPLGGGAPGPVPVGSMGGGGPALQPVEISPADFQYFEGALKNIQAAWSAADLNGLRAMVTPEMLSYFAEQLADLQSKGLRNTVSDVRLLQGDLAQAWTEGGRDYATVAMKFSMIDITLNGAGQIVDGSQTEHVTATELWTFVRARGGQWILSAIQQTRG